LKAIIIIIIIIIIIYTKMQKDLWT